MVSTPPRWVFCSAAMAFVFLCLPTANAQPLCQLPFEAYLTDLDDQPIGGPVDVILNFYEGETAETATFVDCRTFPAQESQNGWIRLEIDGCTAVDEGDCGVVSLGDYFAGALDGGNNLFLGIQLDDTEELTPLIPIGAVPFALASGNSGSLGGIDAGDYVTAENVASTLTAGDIEDLVGAHTAELPFSSITGTATRTQIPESGDADTVDAYHADDFIQADGSVPLGGDWDVAGHRLVNLDVVVEAS